MSAPPPAKPPKQAPPEEWRGWKPLFPALSPFARQALEILPEALRTVWPLNPAHRKSLPDDIQELSRILTCQRASLSQPYWSQPRFISAYLHYFLPWNIIRLGRLLSGLSLALPKTNSGKRPLLVDAGSGPLTLPIALWLAREDWHELPISILALDIARRPMELGQKLFAALGQTLGKPVWPAHLEAMPLPALTRALAPLKKDHAPFLLAAANVLNETTTKKRRGRAIGFGAQDSQELADTGDGENGAPGNLLEAWFPLFDYEARAPGLLFVEPGTRLGGTTIMRLRKTALEHGMAALSPCTHDEACPLLGAASQGSSLASAWCHFVFDTSGAPQWLRELSHKAGLNKQTLSLSPLLLQLMGQKRPENREKFPARVISAPFAIRPDKGMARYACCFAGKCVMANAGAVPSGALVEAALPKNPQRDKKSGLPFITPPKRRTQGHRN